MNDRRINPSVMMLIVFIVAGVTMLTGCSDAHDHGKEEGHAGHGHGHEESPSGASFKGDKGVMLTDETRHSLGVETAEVIERRLPVTIQFTVHVFGEDHKPAAEETHHTECSAKAVGLVAPDKVAQVRVGQPTQLAAKSGHSYGGFVLGVSKPLANGDAEVLVGITNAAAVLKQGEFLSARIVLSQAREVPAVPKSAVLRTAEGTFLFVANGDAYLRTPVKTGAEAEDFAEITDGLFNGDVVVTKPVEKLYLIELRATKGGGHSH